VIDATNSTAWISNWGGRFPRPEDLSAATGSEPGADRVVVDARGIAASGTVSRIDLTSGKVTAEIEVGLHPTSLALDNLHDRLYVANSNSDSISVIDTKTNSVAETIPIQPFAHDVAGVAPESLVLSKDGRHLYVACAGINAIAVLGLKSGHMAVEGLIPTGWYPDAIGLSPDGKYLAVATLLGVGSGWKDEREASGIAGYTLGCPGKRPSPVCRSGGSNRGTIHVIPIPDASALQRYSTAVAANTRMRLKGPLVSATPGEKAAATEMPVPLRAGDPSPIKHIIYIIKENKTYDEYFGGLGKGNGDPALQLYSDDVIPNHRKLAKDFVLLDNFYISSAAANSADGHQWVTQANETDYTRLQGYGGRSYPAIGNDPLAIARGGLIWNAAADAKKTFIDFGEYAGYGAPPKENRQQLLDDFTKGSEFVGMFSPGKPPIESLTPYLAKDYPGFTFTVPDVARAKVFIRHLKEWEEHDDMPSLAMAWLPCDHTEGTRPGASAPRAFVADNDYALGMIVDAVSHSKFWASTLILVVEDDAGAAVDHVDGNRTAALAISPYIKRGSIDSTFYSQTSMLKTIELILGMKNLSIFDLIANDMRNSFQAKPDLTPYTAEVPKQSLFEVNPPLRALAGQAHRDAEASLHMNFTVVDAAPADKLGQILWRSAKGAAMPYPQKHRAVFAPYSNGDDDDDHGKRQTE
jgi:YVTN family beta-propeller protein